MPIHRTMNTAYGDAPDPEVQALLDVWAGVCRWANRAATHCRRELVWRVAAIGSLVLVWSMLGLFARPGVPDMPKTKVVISQAFDQDGRQVTRQEWLHRALSG
jgi:hypothetical protein